MKQTLKKTPGARKLVQALGLTKEDKRMFLLKMLPKKAVCVEIGVHKGDFSEQILNITNPKELNLIDPWKHEESDTYKDAWYGGKARRGQQEMDQRYQSVCNRFQTDIATGKVKIHRDYSEGGLSRFPDNSLDWIYIDRNHLYEFVKKDLELSFEKTKPGGYITGDDYMEEGWWQGGVKKAVDEFVENKPVRLVKLKNRQFILQKQT
jgi:hypothetical protein